MKTAVTGASGHIGANLCRELVGQGYSVRALVHKSTRGIEGIGLDFVTGDLMNPKSLSNLVQGVDAVFHLAAVISIKGKKSELIEKNVRGTRNLIEASLEAGAGRFIHFSTIHALDPEPLDQTMDEERPLVLKDRIAYSRSKALAEAAVLEAVQKGLDAVVLNPTAVIGPHDFGPSLLGRALILMSCGKLPALVRGGYDWVDVRDVVGAAVASIEKGRKGERYILSGCWKNLAELCALVSRLTLQNPPKLTCSLRLAKVGLPFLRLHAFLRNTEPLYTKDSLTIIRKGNKNISHAKASAELGFHPRPLNETIEDTLNWYRQNGYMD